MTDDPLDRLFERMRAETAPAHLEARIHDAIRQRARAPRRRLEDLGETARRGLVPGLLALAASVALAGTMGLTGSASVAMVGSPWRDALVPDADEPAADLWPMGRS